MEPIQEGTCHLQVRLPVTVHQALKHEAKRQERSLNWLITKALQAEVEKLKQGASQ